MKTFQGVSNMEGLRTYQFHIDFQGLQLAFDACRKVDVRDYSVDFVCRCNVCKRALVNLGRIEHRNDLAGSGNHDLIGACFLYAGG